MSLWRSSNFHVFPISVNHDKRIHQNPLKFSKISGEATLGNERLKLKMANRKADPGYLLIGTSAEVSEMKSFRKLDVLTTKIMRLFIHCVTNFIYKL